MRDNGFITGRRTFGVLATALAVVLALPGTGAQSPAAGALRGRVPVSFVDSESRGTSLSEAAVDGSVSMLTTEADEVLENGAGKFRVEIDGLFIDSHEIESVDIDPIELSFHSTGEANGRYRVHGPGDAHYGSITIRSRVGASSAELSQWWLDTSRGQNIRKAISVIALKRDGSEARRFNLLDCFPTSFSEGVAPDGTPVEVLVAKIHGAELFAASDGDGERLASRRAGLYMQLWDPGTAPETTALWRGWAGGEEANFHPLPRTRFHETTPGHKYVDTITLRGPLTSGRKALCQWITETVQGEPWKRMVVIKEILKDGAEGKSFTYIDAFPTRYVFPAFSASGTGNLFEEVTFKPIRLDLS